MAAMFPRRLVGKKVAIFCDFQFEDLELTFPKLRLEEEGCEVVVVGAHPAGTTYKGKHGYPVKSALCVDDFDVDGFDGLVLPGGFAHFSRSTMSLPHGGLTALLRLHAIALAHRAHAQRAAENPTATCALTVATCFCVLPTWCSLLALSHGQCVSAAPLPLSGPPLPVG